MSELPNRIRELRLSYPERFPTRGKMSQERLGDAAGYSKMTISELERGSITLTVEHMRRLAPVLGVEPVELLNESDNSLRLSAEERELIARLRNADAEQRGQFLRISDVMLPPAQDEQDAGRNVA